MLTNLSPRNLIFIVFKRLKLFLGVLTISLSLYAGLVLTQAVQYESNASVLVKIGDSELVTPDSFAEQQRGSAPACARHVRGARGLAGQHGAQRPTFRRVSVSCSTSLLASRSRAARNTPIASLRRPLTHSTSPKWAPISVSGRAR